MGGIAAILHGVPRTTFDLDILVEASEENAARLLQALLAAGLGTANLTSAEEILANEITVFNDIIRVDVQTFTPGLEFAQAWANKVIMHFNNQSFYVLSKADLISSKRGAGRDIDLQAVEALSDLPAPEQHY
jgi:hypothetical protein